ncbi:transposon protein [Musa troglodytarum]|uniref:Transposon protein n=1 Tax=Musa troglodytarum TaxID=320322 RepID=A0A9E7JID8_9LILI|nr:transposon protein [Musa troglodytarum]
MGSRWGPLWRLPPLIPSTVMAILLVVADVGSDVAVKFLKVPPVFSASSSATFQFEVTEGRNGSSCHNCSINCKLDNYNSFACERKEVTYSGLLDGNHTFKICSSGSQGVRCASYNWTVDTVSPTAYISAASFTNALNVSVNISFSEPCTSGGGFKCSPSHCDLLVYGAGQVLPSTLRVLLPGLKFSFMVGISADVQFGRLVLAMDKVFCTDNAGNMFKQSSDSSFILHFDRRSVFMNLTSHIPERLLQLNGLLRTVQASNSARDLKIDLSFSEPVLNSSEEILDLLHASSGLLVPTNKSNLGNRRFGYLVQNISSMTVVTISCDTTYIITRQGTPVSPSDPITFLYDADRPSVRLSTTSNMRTRQHKIPVLINFEKPVFDFNSSAIIISGGSILSFHEITKSTYIIEIHGNGSVISVEVPENKTTDIAGNKNLASNLLQVNHYSMPTVSSLLSIVATVALAMTSMVATLLTLSSSSLLYSGAISGQKSYVVSDPSRNLLVEGIEWSIPYIHLPWEASSSNSFIENSTFTVGAYSEIWERSKLRTFKSPLTTNQILGVDPSVHGKPLMPGEYMSFLENQNFNPEAEFIMISRNSDRWKHFGRNMFWLAIFGGGLTLLHVAILCLLKLRRRDSEKQEEYGALVFPRFELFLVMLALPCICQASAALIKGKTSTAIVVGVVLLGISTSFLISLLLFLSIGITMAKLLQYKEVHQEGQEFHWYQEFIRVTLGPGKRGQWTWTDQHKSINQTKLGPLFEDLRGPPKYMLTQISSKGNQAKHEDQDRIIASEDETEDAEAPFIQKLFGILRIYYTLLESIKRASLGILVGAYSSNRPSRIPTLIILSITSFQLFFLVLKKPFIKKKVQFVEIISVAGEVGLFGACLALLEKDFSSANERRIGFFMLALFIITFTAQLVNEWYALYRQVIRLSPTRNSFSSGLKRALGGLLLVVLPTRLSTNLTNQLSSRNGEGDSGITVTPIGQVQRTSGTSERSWLRQLREAAKTSFSREDAGAPIDPSSSTYQRSVFWSGKRSRSSSVTSSSDSKSKGDGKLKLRRLYKDLEAIFSSK